MSIDDMPRPLIPSVDWLLNHAAMRDLVAVHGRSRIRDLVRVRFAALRADPGTAVQVGVDPGAVAQNVAAELADADRPSLRAVANCTGTVLHTNLGRAALPEEAIAAMADAARSPCNLEYDLADGERGERDHHVSDLIRTLTGAEAALVVNNNAAAVLLVLNTLASRREVIVSRGELVEIGGHFRLPDIMVRAGARMREVGTTNRTHLPDYADAIGPRTGLLLKVHTSNYEIRGFSAAVPERDLARVAMEHGVPLASDLGSGTLADLRDWGLPHEPTAREMVGAGVDLVTFSGDKLLGGPQCGIVVGTAALVAKLRRNPLKRALRVDKLTLAALASVLALYRSPERLAARLPTLRLLTRTPSEIRGAAVALQGALMRVLPARFAVSLVDCASQIGSGALPVAGLPSVGVRIEARVPRRDRNRQITGLQASLRALPLPVIGRVEEGAIVLDCRCVEDPGPVVASLAAMRCLA